MTIPDPSELAGRWMGLNRLWLDPEDPPHESATSAPVAVAPSGAFSTITYTWDYGGKPHGGTLVVLHGAQPSDENMMWVDSFHTGGKFMSFCAERAAEGRVSGLGSYSAPEGPDWGWRIVLTSDGPDQLEIIMYNITPDGEEALAVRAQYSREAAAE
jgi:hypothetical protein